MKNKCVIKAVMGILCSAYLFPAMAQVPIVPPMSELNMPFGNQDKKNFKAPPKVYYPETWFHFIGGNVSLPGITADLEAIKASGISGIQLFHGQFGGAWPGVSPQITCLSPLWNNAVKYTAQECKRLGLRFTMQNCPGWAMAGGPWVKTEDAMRALVWSRTDVDVAQQVQVALPMPQPSKEAWRDYKDVIVVAFPTPEGDTDKVLQPSSVTGNRQLDWKSCLLDSLKHPLSLSSVSATDPYSIEFAFPEETVIRTVELPSITGMNQAWCYEPGISFKMDAINDNGDAITVAQLDIPQSNWQDAMPFSIACSEVKGVKKYRMTIFNKHDISLPFVHLYSAARKNSWEAEAGWTLRSMVRSSEHPLQSPTAYLKSKEIYDVSKAMDASGNLNWTVPSKGKWTFVRVGHVNAGRTNGPAPAEGTGWECDKLSEKGPNVHFAGYIGRLVDGPLKGGLLNGMLMDSWECATQSWTDNMENDFFEKQGYKLRKWIPAILGYVIDDQETTARFLLDWRSTINDLFTNKFFGRMAQLAKAKGLNVQYETSAGDVVPADIMEYYKYADVPMCEFWQPTADSYVGSINFKPIKPTASAARMYGKPRVAAESFTSINLSWDEHWETLKEVANVNYIDGVTHSVFHTYTHNPKNVVYPGTSFGTVIGTPFLRGETWWKYMPEFTTYLARCSYMLERGKPVSDVLWYLGDEMNHKPDQNAAFPAGFKYDYCNPDALLNRLKVVNGQLSTPEGIRYKVLWLPDNERMLPETLEKMYALIQEGAVVVGNAPKGLATLKDVEKSQQRFDFALRSIWGDGHRTGIYRIGKGAVVSGLSLDDALQKLQLKADVKGGDVIWLHRKINGANWYYVCAPRNGSFKGTVDFHCTGQAAYWDPLTGEAHPLAVMSNGGYTSVALDLPHAASCFIVFESGKNIRPATAKKNIIAKSVSLNSKWTLSFPLGWGAPASMQLSELKPWKDLDISAEGKAFSGTATYTTSFNIDKVKSGAQYVLDLGKVDMIAAVTLNGKKLRTLWTEPYRLDLGNAIKAGKNVLKVEVTNTWFNRLVYDNNLPEAQRKTWTIAAPNKDFPLRACGLMGPVVLSVQ